MDMGKCDNANAAVECLKMLREHAPFRFGGEWHVSCTPGGIGVAYRNRRDLSRRMAKEIQSTDQGCGSYTALTVRFA